MKQPAKYKSVAQRRYYMNKILKAEGIEYNAITREIKLKYKSFKDIPEGLRYYIGQCIKLQYNVQYEMF